MMKSGFLEKTCVRAVGCQSLGHDIANCGEDAGLYGCCHN